MCASACVCLKEAAMQCFVLMLFINLVIIVLLFFLLAFFSGKSHEQWNHSVCIVVCACVKEFFFMYFLLFSAFLPSKLFFCFYAFFVLFLSFLFFWLYEKKAQRTLKKSVQTMDTKQAKFVWADATEFFWILIPAGAPIWESNILPAVPPRHNVSFIGLLQCTRLLCSYMGARINTKQNNSFQCQEHHTRSVPTHSGSLFPDQVWAKQNEK